MQRHEYAVSGDATADRLQVTDDAEMFGLLIALTHAVSNPLTVVAAEAASIALRTEGSEAAIADRMIGTSRAAAGDVRRVREVLRRSNFVTKVDLNALIKEILGRRADRVQHAGPAIRLSLGEAVPHAVANASHVTKALNEVLDNAVEAATSVGDQQAWVDVETRWVADEVMIEVSNSGGIDGSPERMFDLFHTTRPERQGVGLSIARGLCVANGGRVWAQSQDGETTICIAIPSA